MKQPELLAQFKQECEAEYTLMEAKNLDYASLDNAFANFGIIEHLSQNRITAEMGFVVRMSDKLQRITNLIARENAVQDEKITDTLRDLSVYSKLLKIYLDSKTKTTLV
jgi:hypothetical protein